MDTLNCDPALKLGSELFWLDAVDNVLIVAVTDVEGTILYANQKFCDISGYTQLELIGSNHRLLNSGHHDEKFFGDMYRSIKSSQTWRGEICNKAKSGMHYWVATTIIPRLDANGKITHFVACRFDITEQKNAQQHLAQMARTDQLTGLLNRFSFQAELSNILERIEITKRKVAVVMLDLDHFKDINDIYGHQMGDDLIKIVSRRIRQFESVDNLVARFGGDEIVITLHDVEGEDNLKQRLEALLCSIQRPLRLGISQSVIYASAGVAVYPKDGNTPNELIKNADIALYQAKKLGRNRYEFYSQELNRSIEKRVNVQDHARRGLLNDEFKLFYQPIISSKTGLPESFEALLRWQHPTYGLLAPGAFIDVFDDHRLSASIGVFVRETAVKQAAAWKGLGLNFGKIAINTTAADFAWAGYTASLISDLAHHNLDTSAISIEVTEGMFLGKQASRVKSEIEELHKAGFEIAFDDFGTGFASLTHLKELPLDKIKIDRSFIQDMVNNASDRKIIASIIELAHSLELLVTAEGIETVEQLNLLNEMRCDQIQGYLISKPVSAEDVPAVYQSKILRQIAKVYESEGNEHLKSAC